jgi:flagellar basal-body rod protein FlgB
MSDDGMESPAGNLLTVSKGIAVKPLCNKVVGEAPMFDRPEIMHLAQELAGHAAARQGQIAQNVANADTPGYRARDVVEFARYYEPSGRADMRTTRPGHAPTAEFARPPVSIVDMNAEPSPNGNSVSLEGEMVKQAETRHQHDMALAVYKNSLDLMRVVIGRGR